MGPPTWPSPTSPKSPIHHLSLSLHHLAALSHLCLSQQTKIHHGATLFFLDHLSSTPASTAQMALYLLSPLVAGLSLTLAARVPLPDTVTAVDMPVDPLSLLRVKAACDVGYGTCMSASLFVCSVLTSPRHLHDGQVSFR